MDASEATAEAAHSPPSETADSTVETSDVPMKTEAPEGYPQEEVSGVKVEHAEGSPLREESEFKDEHMDATEEEVNDETTGKASSPQEEEAMPDISPHTEDEGELHDQGIWGKCKTVADPEAYKATKDAEAQNEDAFENLEKSNDKKGLVDTDEYKEFRSARCCPSMIVGLDAMTMSSDQATFAAPSMTGSWPRHRMFRRRHWTFRRTFFGR